MASATATKAANTRVPDHSLCPHGGILVVDDDDAVRNWFRELLKPQGFAIRTAGSGQEAIALLRQSLPALVVVDVSLPDQDGVAVLEDAQRIDNRIIGVVMTGAPSVELAVRAMKAGAVDFLMKPVPNELVVATVRRLLELHRLRSENTVLKRVAIQSGAVRLSSLPLQTFGDDGVPRGVDGLTEFERGVREGERRAGERDAEKRLEEERRAEERRRHEYSLLADVLHKFEQEQSSLRRIFEEDVVSLAFSIASKVLHDTANTCKDQIVIQAKAALAAVQEPGTVFIQVHPEDVPALEAAQAGLTACRDLALTVKIEPVVGVARGNCLLHTHNRVIDASLDTQLFRLGNALKTRMSHEL